jgi:signal transduction histidine kinase
MRNIKFLILFVALGFLSIIPLGTYAEIRVRTIVIFFPFNASMPSSQNILEGFRNGLSEENEEPYNLQVEFLDIGRLKDEAYIEHIVDLYNEKYSGHKIDLIVTVAPYTYSLLRKYGLEVLDNTPTIKLELDPPIESQDPFIPDKNTLEILVKFRISKTLENAFKLFPDYKEVYIISGCSKTDLYFSSLIKQHESDFKATHHFNFITGVSIDSVIKLTRIIPAKSIVVIPIYLSDNKNIPFSTPEAIRIISENCNSPMFPIFDSFIKTKGGIGGYIFSYIYLGEETGRIANEFFNGKPLKEITLNGNGFYRYIYDWQQLKKWNLLNSKVIPPDSIIYHKEFDFVSEYKWYILVLILFLISETLLVVYLIKLNRRQRAVAIQKEETESLYRELVREDRLLRMAILTASLSHELNQPLTAIMYNAQAGRRFHKSGKLTSERADAIFEKIIENDSRAGELIGSVRDLMKTESIGNGKINVNSIINDTLKIYHSEAIGKQITIRFHQQEEQVYVIGDKIQLQQVILNFLSNATKAMENTLPEDKIIEIRQQSDKELITVAVRDYGSGISDTIKDILFKPFITSHKRGFGIGLAISYSIIERHNGEISAENMVGGGAEFSFRLKRCKDE